MSEATGSASATGGGMLRSIVIPIAVLIGIVLAIFAVVFIGGYYLNTGQSKTTTAKRMQGNVSSEYGVLSYIPVDTVKALTGKGYSVLLAYSITGNYSSPFMSHLPRTRTHSRLAVTVMVGTRKLYFPHYIEEVNFGYQTPWQLLLTGFHGDAGLFEYFRMDVASGTMTPPQIFTGKTEFRSGYKIIVSRGIEYTYITVVNGDESSFVIAGFRNTSFTRDDAEDLAVAVAEGLDRKTGLSSLNPEVDGMVNLIPKDVREIGGLFYLDMNGRAAIIYSGKPIHLLNPEIQSLDDFYLIVHKEIYTSSTLYKTTLINTSGNYLLLHLEKKKYTHENPLMIEDVELIRIQRPNDTVSIVLHISLKNIGLKPVYVNSISVDSKLVKSPVNLILNPGEYHVFSGIMVYEGPDEPTWAIGTIHLVTVTYSIEGTYTNNTVLIKVKVS